MSGPRAVVCLCAYKNAASLPAIFENIKAIRHLFKRLKVLVAYDDSPDDTEAVLKRLQADYQGVLNTSTPERRLSAINNDTSSHSPAERENGNVDHNLSTKRCGGPSECDLIRNTTLRSNIRTERICHARNMLLDRLRQVFPDYDYFIMMDANEYSCVGPIQPGVLGAALARDDWDALSFDREAGYYDYWALSYDPFVYSCYHFDKPYVLDTMRNHWKERLAGAREKAPNDLLEVYSAFNGFAIYRLPLFLKCSYSWKIDMRFFPIEVIIKQSFVLDANIAEHLVDDCEHRKFHMEAIKDHGARVRVSLDYLFLKMPNAPEGLRGPA